MGAGSDDTGATDRHSGTATYQPLKGCRPDEFSTTDATTGFARDCGKHVRPPAAGTRWGTTGHCLSPEVTGRILRRPVAWCGSTRPGFHGWPYRLSTSPACRLAPGSPPDRYAGQPLVDAGRRVD